MPRRTFDEPLAAEWTRILPRLRRLARALAGREHDADDLTQQTLLKVLTAAPDRLEHAGFVRRTMVRVWLDQQRSTRRGLERLVRRAAWMSGWLFPRDVASESEQTERIRAAVATLPPLQQAAFVLRVVEELEYEDIAAALDCSVAAVRANLHLARRAVRAALGEPS